MTVSRRAATCLALLGALAWLPRLGAQSPAERVELERFRDSIGASVDTARLEALESEWIARARTDRDAPMPHLRLGLIALRLAILQPGAHLDDAIGEFEWAAELRPNWPWPWYGLGLAEARAEDRAGGFAGGLWTMLGLDRDRLAGEAFAKAVDADPTFVVGLLEFARIALDQRVDAPTASALRALRSATSSPIGWHPELLIARGRLERLVGSADSARIAFERALLLGNRPDLVHLELARTLPMVTGADDAAVYRAYLAGADSRNAEVVALYRRDLEPVAEPGALATFDTLSAESRADWLASYWERVGARDLRRPEARLAEHFRRWDVARREFRLPPFRRRYRWGLELYQSGDQELDDRGVIWLRHGEPTLRVEWPRAEYVRSPARRNYGNESWRYDRPEGALVLHFVAHDDPQDYRVVDSPRALDVPVHALEARAHELPGLDRMLRAGQYSADWVSDEVREHGRASRVIATRSTAWERQYPSILTGRALWLAAGERDGRPLAHMIYAVDADSLRRLGASLGRDVIPMRVRASFIDRGGRVVATLDTTQAMAVPGPGARLVAARVEVPVAPGVLRIRYGIEADTNLGVVYPVDSIVAPQVSGSRLHVSALLVGREDASLSWIASPSDTAWVDAGGIYHPTDTVTVYAEAYGVPAGADVSVELTLTRQRRGLLNRLFGGGGEAFALREDLTAPGGVLRLRRGVALGHLEPGAYVLELVIRAGSREISRYRGLSIQR